MSSPIERDRARRSAPDLAKPPSASTASQSIEPLGISRRFKLTVDGDLGNLGYWSKCTGLAVTFKSKPRFEGGNYSQPAARLAEMLEYSPIVLERAMSKPWSSQVYAWLKSMNAQWFNNPDASFRGFGGATITLLDSRLVEVQSWSLMNVYPSKWTGPQLDAMGSDAVAKETLELVHGGFL